METCCEKVLKEPKMGKRETVRFKIKRFNPEKETFKELIYYVPLQKGMTVLDALNYIKDKVDGTLSYRFSCRMGICGSCAVQVNGKPVLACCTQVADVMKKEIIIEPLPNFPLIKDLVVDFSFFMNKYKNLKPFLLRKKPATFEKEIPQTVNEHSRIWSYSLCIKCGICFAACPTSPDENFLGPTHLSTLYRFMADSRDQGLKERLVICQENAWLCTQCSSCNLTCPKEVEIAESIVEIRKLLTEEGKLPRSIIKVLLSLRNNYNPWGFSSTERNKFLMELGVKPIKDMFLNPEENHLFFTCCTASYDQRCKEAAEKIVKSFRAGGLALASFGNMEWCCGDSASKLGEKGLYEYLAEHNFNLIKNSGLRKVVTISPHCYDTLKKKEPYKRLGLKVKHYTEVLAELIDKGELIPQQENKLKVTYHDPCYLGKINKVFEEPRKIIKSLPGAEFVEMERNRENSFCCGGGGGRLWSEESVPHGERPSMERIKEAIKLGVDVVATACPFCLIMLSDAVKTMGVEEKIKVEDIGSLVYESLKKNP